MNDELANKILNFDSNNSNNRVLVIGDLMIDNYLYGKAARLSPEAPVPVVEYSKQEIMLGGCGNVIKNLVSFGIGVSIISVVGKDKNGFEVEKQLIDLGVDVYGLIKSESRVTTEKMRVIAQNQQIVRFDREVTFDLCSSDERAVCERIDKIINNFNLVLISDYSKGVVTDAVCRHVIKMCNTTGKFIMVDPKPKNFQKYTGVNLVKPNLVEAESIIGRKLDSLDSLFSATEYLRINYKISSIVITMGSLGAYFNNGSQELVEGHDVSVYDVSGAGDTFFAALTFSKLLGLDLRESIEFSNAASSIVIQKFGSQVTTVNEVLKLISDEK
jgi:D-beta-D-heptose 7-phosphate kinase/D-beta-D-heptose 1-phosphate adenosyltransferase